MSKILRVTQQIFGASATNNGQFGSGQAGTKVTTSSIATIMALPAWAQGWLSAVLGASKYPPLEEMQGIEYVNTTQLAYLFQQGIPEYDAGTTYFVGSLCMNPGTFQVYGSLTNNNVGNALTSSANWEFLLDLSNQRIPVTGANQNFYVSGAGSDTTGNGTSAANWATIQHAVNVIASTYDCRGQNVIINVGNGSYVGPTITESPTGGGTIIINGVNAANTTITGVDAVGGTSVQIQNATFSNPSGHAVQADQQARVFIGAGCAFGATSGSHLVASNGGLIIVNNSYTISGSANAHFFLTDGAQLNASAAIAVSVSTPVAFAAFASAQSLSSLDASRFSFSGSAVTGARYSANNNSVINTNGAGTTFFPGSTSGSAVTGAQYV